MRYLDEHEIFVCDISGGMGSCPPPVSPPVSPPPPPAIPSLVGTPAGAVVGSQWVEGSERHYIAQGGTEHGGTGVAVATPAGAVVGSEFEESEDATYVDASGMERRLQATTLTAKPAPAVVGSEWVDSGQPSGRQLLWITSTSKRQWWNGGVP